MAGRRRNTKNSGSAAGRPVDDTPHTLDVAAWARRVLEDAAKEMSDEELAVLEGQVKTLARSESSPAALPPDPTAPTVIRDRKSLKQVAARLESAPEVVID